MKKIVINTCYGGFSLSSSAEARYTELTNTSDTYYRGIARDDPALIQTVEELGNAANGPFANLNIVEIPDDVNWEITEYDGYEYVAEKHRTWR